MYQAYTKNKQELPEIHKFSDKLGETLKTEVSISLIAEDGKKSLKVFFLITGIYENQKEDATKQMNDYIKSLKFDSKVIEEEIDAEIAFKLLSQVQRDFKDDFKDNTKMIVPSFKKDTLELVLITRGRGNNS